MNFVRRLGDSEGASATATRPNLHNDQRQPRKITVENFTNQQIDVTTTTTAVAATDDRATAAAANGLLPFSSRETTPLTAADDMKSIEEKDFIYGNPFVEVTKGIIHIYKKK